MVTSTQIQQNSASRVWMIQNQAGPNNEPSYEGLARADTPEDPRGDVTPIYIPDPDSYGRFVAIGVVRGNRGLPTLTITWFFTQDARSVWDKFVRTDCPHDLQIHFGLCTNPQDFDKGWKKALAMLGAHATSWSATSLGALQPDQQASVTEEIPFTSMEMFFLYNMTFNQQAETQVVQEIIDIKVCDSVSCGECGDVSDGCQTVFALTLTNAGSPGLPPELLFTRNAGLTWTERTVTTLAVNENGDEIECVGANLVIISEDSESLHYAPIADILNQSEVWTEVTTGFVVGNGPLAMDSASPRHTWIVGENGYIYFTDDPTTGVTVQDAGTATIENLLDVHAYDINNVLVVGNNNVVLVTSNGGQTWQSIVGPAAGVNMRACWMVNPRVWWIGGANGRLYFTLDAGANWTEKTFPGSGAGQIDAIAFSNRMVGYLSHRTATPTGRILRSINGGSSWYVAPEGNTTIPDNDRLNALAVCTYDPNVVWAGGLAGDATDGIIIHGAGPE